MKHLLGSIFALIFIYFSFDYVQAKINAFEWTQDTRSLSIGLYVILLLVVNMVILMHTDINRKN